MDIICTHNQILNHLPLYGILETLLYDLITLTSGWQAQFVQVFPLKPAPLCKLSVGFGSTNKSAISFLFFFSPTLALSLSLCPCLRHCFYLKLSNTSGRNCLLSPLLLSGCNGSPDTRFSRKATRLISWPS